MSEFSNMSIMYVLITWKEVFEYVSQGRISSRNHYARKTFEKLIWGRKVQWKEELV